MSRWRVGRKLGRTLYRDEEFVGTMDTKEIAAEIIQAMNARERVIQLPRCWRCQRGKSLFLCQTCALMVREHYRNCKHRPGVAK